MIREELYKWLEPEFAVLKLIDFFPWTQDLGNNYVHNFFYKIVMIYDFFSFLTVHKPSLGSFKAIKKSLTGSAVLTLDQKEGFLY